MANKYLNPDGIAYLWEKIKNALAGKVDKVSGKGLSSNDYTSAEKTKLSGIATGAQVNVLEGVQVNGTSVTPTNKIANIAVPTATSDLTNDSGFITSADIPEGAAASTTTPKMDGTAAVGTELAFARGDHVHPSDSNKVDKVSGKGLSTNDFTTALKSKLEGIAAGAEVNVQSDWNAVNGDAYILNKPTIPSAMSDLTNDDNYVQDASYVHTDNNYTTAEKTKLAGIASGAEANVQSDWNVTSSTSDAFIKNKPTIPTKTSDLTNDSDFVSDANYVHTDNNYTTAEKNKLSGIATGANKTTVDSSMSASSTNPVQNKIVKKYIDDAVGSITGIDFQVVTALPTTGVKGTIYLLSNSGSGTNAYDEYIYVSDAWEKIGTTDIDLSGYMLKTDMVAITNAEIDTITAE